MHAATVLHRRFKPTRGSCLRLSLVVASLLLASGCQSQSPPVSQSVPAKAHQADLRAEADLLAQIRNEMGTAICSSDAQCRTLPVGAKACGGPQAWVPWSTQMGRPEVLRDWADQLATLQRLRHARSGELSNCQHYPDPGSMCQAQRCVLRTPSLAN